MTLATRFHPDGLRLRRILHGILQQVAHDTPERFAIGVDEEPAVIGMDLDIVSVGAGLPLILLDAVLHELREIERFELVLAAAGVHAAEIEEIFDEMMQSRCLLL